MEQEKVKYLIDIINNMDIKDKLRKANGLDLYIIPKNIMKNLIVC